VLGVIDVLPFLQEKITLHFQDKAFSISFMRKKLFVVQIP